MSDSISRRTFIGASAAAVLAPLAHSQTPDVRFSVRSRSGLRLERYGDPRRPAVALYLPKGTTPSVVIEMPEHAWYKERPSDDQTWFYKSSAPALSGRVEWSASRDSLSFSMRTPSGFVLNTKAFLGDDGVAITHEVVSGRVLQVAAIEAPTCVKLYRPFTDIFLERTYLHLSDGLDLIASDTPDRLAKNAEEWLPCRYIARVGKNAPDVDYRTERLDGVTRHYKSKSADAAFLATESDSSGWTVATYASNCDSVFTNPARTCHHADPRARSLIDGRAMLPLKVLVIRGKARDAWKLVKL